jgi:hypothetical protein
MSNVGASTAESSTWARSGRPPRDTTASTISGLRAAASMAAAAPVLAPNSPISASVLTALDQSVDAVQSTAAVSRAASRPMSKRNSPVRSSTAASRSERRSMSSVASPPS